MKVSPVSGDFLIKLALGGVALVVGYVVISKGIKALAELPGKVYEAVAKPAREGGAEWQGGYQPNYDPYSNEGRNHPGPLYNNPMVNDAGYDFGQLSG